MVSFFKANTPNRLMRLRCLTGRGVHVVKSFCLLWSVVAWCAFSQEPPEAANAAPEPTSAKTAAIPEETGTSPNPEAATPEQDTKAGEAIVPSEASVEPQASGVDTGPDTSQNPSETGTHVDGAIAGPDPSQPVDTEPVVDYDIQVRLDPELKTLYGRQTLVYRNQSPDIIVDLQFHTYLNAFKNEASNYWLETARRPKGDEFGYIHIRQARATIDGVDQTGLSGYHRNEDGEPTDQTVWRMELMGPLLPGQAVTVIMEFESRLPLSVARTGYADDFFMAAQWFPKIGVWETAGMRGRTQSGWNCRHFHNFTEFYANFGQYRVAITAPEDYMVAATGKLVSQQTGPGGFTQTFEQDRVHDFAFCAGQGLVRHSRVFEPAHWVKEEDLQAVMALHGINREQAQLKPVEMILLIHKEHEHQVDRHFNALANGLKYLGLWYGHYPYETMTMIDPPPERAGPIGGMEYPTLILNGTRPHRAIQDYRLESLILHEFAHQYFYGMIGSNEFEEPWMDEGMTTYAASAVLDRAYGTYGLYRYPTPFKRPVPVTDWLGVPRWDRVTHNKLRLRREPFPEPIVKPGWQYFSRRHYGANAYSKPALMLSQLERELGSETMNRCMRTFFQRWQFKHPSTEDFIAAVEEVSGREMRWFFDELFYKAGFLDYEVLPIQRRRVAEGTGYRDGLDGPLLATREQEAEARDDDPFKPKTFRQIVRVRNHGNIHYPVDVQIVFEDGSDVVERWDGRGTWVKFQFDNKPAIQKVILDPEGKLLIDRRQANNSYIKKADTAASQRLSGKVLTFFQHVLQSMAGVL